MRTRLSTMLDHAEDYYFNNDLSWWESGFLPWVIVIRIMLLVLMDCDENSVFNTELIMMKVLLLALIGRDDTHAFTED